MNFYKILKRTSWFIVAAASICIGLDAFGFDVETMLNLQSMDTAIRYVVGICGVASLVDLVMMHSCCTK